MLSIDLEEREKEYEELRRTDPQIQEMKKALDVQDNEEDILFRKVSFYNDLCLNVEVLTNYIDNGMELDESIYQNQEVTPRRPSIDPKDSSLFSELNNISLNYFKKRENKTGKHPKLAEDKDELITKDYDLFRDQCKQVILYILKI